MTNKRCPYHHRVVVQQQHEEHHHKYAKLIKWRWTMSTLKAVLLSGRMTIGSGQQVRCFSPVGGAFMRPINPFSLRYTLRELQFLLMRFAKSLSKYLPGLLNANSQWLCPRVDRLPKRVYRKINSTFQQPILALMCIFLAKKVEGQKAAAAATHK